MVDEFVGTLGTSVVVVYNTRTGELLFNGVAENDTSYQAWRNSRHEVQTSPLFINQYTAGRPSGDKSTTPAGPGPLPHGSPLVTSEESYIPYIEHSLVDTGTMSTSFIVTDPQGQYGEYYEFTQLTDHDYKAAYYDPAVNTRLDFPMSHVFEIGLPDAPVRYCSVLWREVYHNRRFELFNEDGDENPLFYDDYDGYYHDYFSGPLGALGDDTFSYQARYYDTYLGAPTTAYGSGRYLIGSVYFDPVFPTATKNAVYDYHNRYFSGRIAGVYSDKTSAFCMVVVYLGMNQEFQYDYNSPAPHYTQDDWTPDDDITVLIQSQVVFDNNSPIRGIDILLQPTNAALNTVIAQAVRTCYSINGLTQTVKQTVVDVEILN